MSAASKVIFTYPSFVSFSFAGITFVFTYSKSKFVSSLNVIYSSLAPFLSKPSGKPTSTSLTLVSAGILSILYCVPSSAIATKFKSKSRNSSPFSFTF